MGYIIKKNTKDVYRKKIPGAMRIGNYWAVPADAERPKDGRIKSGRYIKLKKKQ